MLMIKLNIVYVFMFLIGITSVYARGPEFIPSDDEIRFLPAYCAAKIKGINEKHWRGIIGEDFGHLHHLCFAHNAKRKALTRKNADARKYLNERALANYEYIENHVSKKFILYPIVYIEKAEVYRRMKQNDKAEEYYLKAIRIKPDYAKSYVDYSRFLKKTNQKEQAKKILEQGIEVNPDSKILKKRLKRLMDDK